MPMSSSFPSSLPSTLPLLNDADVAAIPAATKAALTKESLAAAASTTTNGNSNSSSSSNSSSNKTIILIRHAESEENRRLSSLGRCFTQLGRFSWCTYNDLSDAMQLLHITALVDSDVSDVGREQIEHMHVKLQNDNFVQDSGIRLVAHSPLNRAKQTSAGMLGCMAPHTKAASVDRVVQLDELLEKTPSEWIPLNSASLYRRIAMLETWLGAQPEPVIALVGHSQFFKAMLGLNFKFGNCEVWQVTFDPTEKKTTILDTAPLLTASPASSSSSIPSAVIGHEIQQQASMWALPPRWTNLKRLYTCEISRASMTTPPPTTPATTITPPPPQKQ